MEFGNLHALEILDTTNSVTFEKVPDSFLKFGDVAFTLTRYFRDKVGPSEISKPPWAMAISAGML